MAADENQRTAHEHRSAFALAVEEIAQEWSDDSSTDREPTEDVGSIGWRNSVEVTLQHVCAITLEWEDGRIVEHTEKGNYPEHL